MTNTIDNGVLEFIRNQLCQDKSSSWYTRITSDYSLSTDRYALLNETAIEILEAYSSYFNVDMSNFDFDKYWPNTGIPFLPNFLLPHYLRIRTSRHDPKPLTVKMLIESVKAGRWLYDKNE